MTVFAIALIAFAGIVGYSAVVGVVLALFQRSKWDSDCAWITAVGWPVMVPLAFLVECVCRIARFSAKKTARYLNRPRLPKAQARNKE